MLGNENFTIERREIRHCCKIQNWPFLNEIERNC